MTFEGSPCRKTSQPHPPPQKEGSYSQALSRALRIFSIEAHIAANQTLCDDLQQPNYTHISTLPMPSLYCSDTQTTPRLLASMQAMCKCLCASCSTQVSLCKWLCAGSSARCATNSAQMALGKLLSASWSVSMRTCHGPDDS